MVAKRPRADRLEAFDLTPTNQPGVYGSRHYLLERVTVIVLSELENIAHNAFVKCFATQKKAKEQAFHTLENARFGLMEATVITYLLGLQQLWSEGETPMSNEITPEKVMEMGEKWIDVLLATLPPEQIVEHYRPEDLLRQYRPEERLKGLHPEEVLRQYRPEELFSNLEPEEIEAYLQQLKKQKKLHKTDRQIEG